MIFDKTKGLMHVLYEMKMFAHTTSYLMKADSNKMTNDDYVYLESWTIHLRNFLYFFKDEGSFKYVKDQKVPNDDIMYFDYVSKNKKIIDKIANLNYIRGKVDKYTAHLSCKRINEYSWKIYPKYEIISKAFEIFLQELDSNYITNFVREIEEIKELDSKIKSERNQSINSKVKEPNQMNSNVQALNSY